MRPRAYIQLGRIGDILNILPLMWRLNRSRMKPVLCVAESNRSVVERLNYVEPHYYPGHHDLSVRAAEWMRLRRPGYDTVISQVWNNPDQHRRTPSFATESWRLAGDFHDQHGMWPLVLQDSGDVAEGGKILVAASGISSPYDQGPRLLAALRQEFGDAVVDLGAIQKPRVADLVPMFDAALCLVTIDTMHLHLARASDVPVVALLNEGWLGSPVPPNTVSSFRYPEATPERIVAAVRSVVRSETGKIWHAVDLFGQSERHKRAQASWGRIGAERVSFDRYGRTAKDIGDRRELPYLKDLLQLALDRSAPHDIIAWTGDDVAVSEGTEAWLRLNVGRFGAVSARRDIAHVGRDLFAFRADWLRQHWQEIPDVIIGAPDFDMGLAALIRAKRGLRSSLANLSIDFPGCEPKGAGISHEPHRSEWLVPGYEREPAVKHNRGVIVSWASRHAPWMTFNPEGVIT
jgi:hypothetical protein